jgi:hypothetical protein
MDVTQINEAFEALQARVKTIEDALNQRASPAFEGQQARIQALEAKIATYEPLFEMFQANHEFFKDIIKRLEPRFVTLEGKVTALEVVNENNSFSKDMLKGLKSLAEATKTQAVAKPRVDSPEKFSGKREDWKSFRSQLELFFLAQSSQYPTDASKIMFALSRLGDTAAYKYMERHIPAFKLDEEDRPAIITDIDKFWSVMTKNFGVTNAHIVAESQLRALKQKGSALDYTNKFVQLVADTEWNDAAKISQYRIGLKEAVQEAMSRQEEPRKFSEFSDLAIEVDTRQYGYFLQKQPVRSTPVLSTTRNSTPVAAPRSFVPAATAPAPSMAMDLSQAQHRPVSAEEKQRRRDNDLCSYCGLEGHWVKECPTKPAGSKPGNRFNHTLASATTANTNPFTFSLGNDDA